MKKFIALSIGIFLMIAAFSQTPGKFSYQFVIRNSSQEVLTSTTVGVRISILSGSAEGTPVYTETHTPASDAAGVVSISVGAGTTGDDFSSIQWGNGLYFLKCEADPDGGTNYTITGTTQILSVPYALYSAEAERLAGTAGTGAGSGLDADLLDGNDSGYFIQDLSGVLSRGNDAGGNAIANLADPTGLQDAATKAYVDALLERIEAIEIQTGMKVKDSDGNMYETVTIGTQIWMAENLKSTKYSDGTDIEYPGSDNTSWENNTAGAYAYYDNDPGNGEIYGALYNWHAVNTGKLCPDGWHVPSDAEWQVLDDYLGGSLVSGGKLKATGTLEGGDGLWKAPNTGATDEYGFTALPGGYRYSDGSYLMLETKGTWWSSSVSMDPWMWGRSLISGGANMGRENPHKNNGSSVRCIKD